MTTQRTNISKLCNTLGQSSDLVEFTHCINKAKDDLYGLYSDKKIKKRSIAFYSDNRLKKNKYKTFNIKKKSGKDRIIHAPHKGLKAIQRAINHLLVNTFDHHQSTFGFVPQRSIVDGACLHVGKHYVFNIDLKDFFPSISSKRVAAVLQLPPFKFTQSNAVKVANICTTELEVDRIDSNNESIVSVEQVLPQGAPTSPVITNIICQRLDRKLYGVSKRFGLTYSRYADDITFSSDHFVYGKNSAFKKELLRIIEGEGFSINQAKTRLLTRAGRQEVTGIVVNEKVNVSRKYIKQIRTMLHNWESKGYEQATAIFAANYGQVVNKGGVVPAFENVVEGKLRYLGMVKGFENTTYVTLVNRFKRLASKEWISKSLSPNKSAVNDNVIKKRLIDTNPQENRRPVDPEFDRLQGILKLLKNTDLKKAMNKYGKE